MQPASRGVASIGLAIACRSAAVEGHEDRRGSVWTLTRSGGARSLLTREPTGGAIGGLDRAFGALSHAGEELPFGSRFRLLLGFGHPSSLLSSLVDDDLGECVRVARHEEPRENRDEMETRHARSVARRLHRGERRLIGPRPFAPQNVPV
jgi:hypothetical protein